ncbi:hypothetical protein CCUS01_09049 [Colletotrichum cuscutae]|uniref:Uncharacterized protein n=1 Tax=Colletotrichum cuscutae TaxID=1209917 RepID=A0AAI9UI48_9PEZI|nr:hypothetical protein CCUS01_09049 [Colletotrichum cuscutae]
MFHCLVYVRLSQAILAQRLTRSMIKRFLSTPIFALQGRKGKDTNGRFHGDEYESRQDPNRYESNKPSSLSAHYIHARPHEMPTFDGYVLGSMELFHHLSSPIPTNGPVSLSTSSNPERWVGLAAAERGWLAGRHQPQANRRPNVQYSDILEAATPTRPLPPGPNIDFRGSFSYKLSSARSTGWQQRQIRKSTGGSYGTDGWRCHEMTGQGCRTPASKLPCLTHSQTFIYVLHSSAATRPRRDTKLLLKEKKARQNAAWLSEAAEKVGGYGRGSELLQTPLQDRDGGRGDAPRTMPASCFAFYEYDDGQALRELKASSRKWQKQGLSALSYNTCMSAFGVLGWAMARWHGWEWELEATPHRCRFDNGTPKAKDAAKSSVGAPAATTKTSLTFANSLPLRMNSPSHGQGHGSYAGKSQSCLRTPLFSAAYLDPNFADISDLNEQPI